MILELHIRIRALIRLSKNYNRTYSSSQSDNFIPTNYTGMVLFLSTDQLSRQLSFLGEMSNQTTETKKFG